MHDQLRPVAVEAAMKRIGVSRQGIGLQRQVGGPAPPLLGMAAVAGMQQMVVQAAEQEGAEAPACGIRTCDH